MDHYIECPVCEERFHVHISDPEKKLTCVGCKRKFLFSAAAKLATPSPATNSKTEGRLAIPHSPVKPSTKPQENEEPAPPETQTESIELSKTAPLTSRGLQNRRRNKRKVIKALATVIVLAAIIGILSGLLIMRLSRTPVSADQSGTEKVELPQAADTETKDPDTAGPETSNANDPALAQVAPGSTVKEVADTKILFKDLPEQKFEYYDKKAVDECWDLVVPHLLSLTVHDAYGTHPAVGTIIDSRGWIVTSYSAIKGASKIEVRASAKKIDELPNNNLLSDIVRGVIAVEPSKDLAILSVNRRFVQSFADIAITDENRVIVTEFLIQHTPPSGARPYGRSETKMQFCGTAETLSDSGKTEVAKRSQIATDSYWLVCPDKQQSLPGSPLTRISGILEAINVFNKDDLAYYVPVHELKALMSDSADEPQPLSVLGGSDLSDVAVALSADHPARNASVSLNQFAKQCEEFNWIPAEKSQYESLQAFSEKFAELVQYTETNQDSDPERVAQVKSQIDQARNSIAKALTSLGAKKNGLIRSFNKLAAEDLNTPNRTVPFYGTAIGLEVSYGKDFLELDNANAFVALIPDSKRDPFNYDDHCLAFVRTNSKPAVVTYPVANSKVPATTVRLIFRINDNR